MSNEEEKEEEDVGADAGMSEPGVPGVQWHPQILAHQLTLSQPEGSNYAHHITKGQLCPFGVFKSSKKTTKFLPGFLP